MPDKKRDLGKWEKCHCSARQCTGHMNNEDKDAEKQREIPVELTEDFDTMRSY
jgi:hypothetical protein